MISFSRLVDGWAFVELTESRLYDMPPSTSGLKPLVKGSGNVIKFWLVQKVLKADGHAQVVHIYSVEGNARAKARSLCRALNDHWKVQVVTLVPHVVEDIVSYSSDTLIRLAQKSR